MVDEYPDTNRLQSTILLGLKPDGHGLTVVGDDAHRSIRFAPRPFVTSWIFLAVQPAAAVITLDRNYRSSQPILAAANAVIDLAAERFTKNLWTDRNV